jgi:dihydroflavonol-4-reductase
MILVTGASGFLGSAVVRALLANGEKKIRALVRKGSILDNVPEGVNVINGDLRDPSSLTRACRGCTGLYHVAADYRLWSKRPLDLYESNVNGTRNLMDAALDAGIQRIVHTSSVATIRVFRDGRSSNEETTSSITDMVGHYKKSKFLAEELVSNMIARDGLPAVIVNPSTPVGPFDIKPTPTGRVIRDAAKGKIPAYVDTGLNVAHVDDIANGHLLAFTKGEIGRKYILGGENLTLKEILVLIAAWCGHPAPRWRLPIPALYPIAWASESWAFLRNGPEPQTTIDGLKMAAKKMFFDSSRAISELTYSTRPARVAIIDALEWLKKEGHL